MPALTPEPIDHTAEACRLARAGERCLTTAYGTTEAAEAYGTLALVHARLAALAVPAPSAEVTALRRELRDLLGQAPAVTLPSTRDADAFGAWLDRLRTLAGGG